MLPDIEIILTDIERGYDHYGDLVHSHILTEQLGNCGCCEENYMCLLYTLLSLTWRLEQELLDETTEILYRQLITAIGADDSIFVRYYYGTTETSVLPTVEEIELSNYVETVSEAEPIIPYPIEESPVYYWMAELSNQPVKTEWQDTIITFNKGGIGGVDDLFTYPTIVSSYRVYQTVYDTQFTYPIQYKIGEPIEPDGFQQMSWIDEQLDGLDNNEEGFNVLVD